MQESTVLFLLGGSLIQNFDGTWRTTRFNEGDNFGILGDYVRPIATSLLYKNKREGVDMRIIVLGGKGQLEGIPGAPYISEIIRTELVKEGVPDAHIETECVSGNTYQQLSACVRIMQERDIDSEGVAVLSNEYHVPRLQTMVETCPELSTLRGATFISAESVLLEHERDRWKTIFDTAYASVAMKERIVCEQQGIKAIRAGTYKW